MPGLRPLPVGFLLGSLAVSLLVLTATLFYLWLQWGGGGLLTLWILCAVGAFGAGAGAVRLRGLRRTALGRRREQRLWRSGPLGRKWLEDRARLGLGDSQD